MNLRHLHFFAVLAEDLNFTRAAERLHVAQPALSQQMRALEEQIGVVLIDRTLRPLRLTTAGTYFLAEAKQILAQYEQAKLGAREIEVGKRGWLGVGFTRSATYSVLPPALKQFNRDQPGVELKLFELLTEHQADALRERRIHVGIGRQTEDVAGYTRLVLLQEKLMVALPIEHPLARRKRVHLAQLADVPFIIYPKHPQANFVKLILNLCRDSGFTPHIAHQTFEMQTAIALVAAGLGVTMVAESVANHGRSDVAYRPLEASAVMHPTTLTATFRSDDTSGPLLSFLKLLVQNNP